MPSTNGPDKSLVPIRLREVIGKSTASEFIYNIGGGISKQSISSYLSGKRSPKTEFIKAVSDAYGVQIAWLLGYDVPKYANPDDARPDEDIVLLSRAAKKMSPENRKKLIDMARLMFDDAFDD